MGTRRRTGAVAIVALALLLSAGCAPQDPGPMPAQSSLPPAGGTPDYQLGGAYEPDAVVDIVARDRRADPDPTRYSICYVNGFQTQPGEEQLWPGETLLHDAAGPVTDPDWPDEVILDTSSAASRERILAIVTPWISGCADDGFDAVEFDNLDTYTRSAGALTREDNLALASAYVDVAHRSGLAAAQKNSAEDAALLEAEAGFDFAIAEECAAYSECGRYTEVYGEHVIDIEYGDALPRPFSEMCSDPETPASVVLRDRRLVRPTDSSYLFAACP